MRRIVVGFDGSAGSRTALEWAVAEAHIRNWPVTALLAWGWIDQYHHVGDGFSPEYDADTAERELRLGLTDVLGDRADAVAIAAVCDLPANAILDAVDDRDLLVVGARGHGGFLGLRLGSVSESVLHRSPCPVAIIREGAPALRTTAPVVVGIDGSEPATAALDWAADEAKARDVPLEIVHAWQPRLVGFESYAFAPATFDAIREAATDVLRTATDRAEAKGVRVTPRLEDTQAASALVAASSTAGLVVVGTRGRGLVETVLVGSVAKQVAHHAESPVVAVPHAG